jgi:hypothetical protein
MVAREATPVSSMFGDLSNYELLCWIGSASGATIWESFKSIRPCYRQSNKNPSNFTTIPWMTFDNPIEIGKQKHKLKFRKCKIIVVSVDELSTA